MTAIYFSSKEYVFFFRRYSAIIKQSTRQLGLWISFHYIRSSILSRRRYVITANTIKMRIYLSRACTCLRVFTKLQRGKKIIDPKKRTNDTRMEKDAENMVYLSFLFFFFIYKQRRKLKRSLSPPLSLSLHLSLFLPRKKRSCIRYESLRFSPLFGPPYKSTHSTAINNQLFTRFCPQTLF